MKKKAVFSVVLLVLLTVLLNSCVITLFTRYNDIDINEVSSIDIYDLRGRDAYGSNFCEDTDPVYTLEEEQESAFLESLGEIRFRDMIFLIPAAVDPSFYYYEWAVRVNYADGSYRLISYGGYGEFFDADGQRTDSNHYGCDDDEWRQLIGEYLPEELFSAPVQTASEQT